MKLMYRDRLDPANGMHASPWLEKDPTSTELERAVRYRESLFDSTVVWAEVFDYYTGDVVVRYEHPLLRVGEPE